VLMNGVVKMRLVLSMCRCWFFGCLLCIVSWVMSELSVMVLEWLVMMSVLLVVGMFLMLCILIWN